MDPQPTWFLPYFIKKLITGSLQFMSFKNDLFINFKRSFPEGDAGYQLGCHQNFNFTSFLQPEEKILKKRSSILTVSIDSSQKVFMQSHWIKTFINLIIWGEELLPISWESATINLSKQIIKICTNHKACMIWSNNFKSKKSFIVYVNRKIRNHGKEYRK